MQQVTLTICGQILLWLGFLGGAFASVQYTEVAEAPWQTIPWGVYAGSVLVGTAGVVCLRREKAIRQSLSGSSEHGFESVKQSLQIANEKIGQLQSTLSGMSCEEVLEFIDNECVPPINEFADGRAVISNRFGTSTYAAVMTEFASGERYLNRAWSAAADGYVDEVERSVSHSRVFFAAAIDQLKQA
ncbi:MAG: hypothetical protein KDB22_21360 [Planctomycetales bacterium]|nr:hypothetical protein [Planctomycetales bacterium]